MEKFVPAKNNTLHPMLPQPFLEEHIRGLKEMFERKRYGGICIFCGVEVISRTPNPKKKCGDCRCLKEINGCPKCSHSASKHNSFGCLYENRSTGKVCSCMEPFTRNFLERKLGRTSRKNHFYYSLA